MSFGLVITNHLTGEVVLPFLLLLLFGGFFGIAIFVDEDKTPEK